MSVLFSPRVPMTKLHHPEPWEGEPFTGEYYRESSSTYPAFPSISSIVSLPLHHTFDIIPRRHLASIYLHFISVQTRSYDAR